MCVCVCTSIFRAKLLLLNTEIFPNADKQILLLEVTFVVKLKLN
jgi:hypothetical protein